MFSRNRVNGSGFGLVFVVVVCLWLQVSERNHHRRHEPFTKPARMRCGRKSSISGTTAKWRAIIEQEQAVSQTETEKLQRDAGTVEELVEKTREHQVDVELRFTSKRKNCRIKEQDSDSEGAFGRAASSRALR